MRGCLTLPFRLVFLALLVVGVLVAWSYRVEIRRRIHAWTTESAPPASVGRADPALVAGARRRILALRSRDSVVLRASEVASLIAADADARVPGSLDSVEVQLGRNTVEVRGRLDTRRVKLPLGPATGLLREREPVEAAGRLVFRRSGVAEWEVERVRVRGLPVPQHVVDGLLRQLSGTAASGGAEIPLPPSVGGLRVSPAGLVLYGLAPAGAGR